MSHQTLWPSGGSLVMTLILLLFSALNCERAKEVVSSEEETEDPQKEEETGSFKPGPADPPYSAKVTYPSRLALSLGQDGKLTGTYPDPGKNPFGADKVRHYQKVGYFISTASVPTGENVSKNFKLSEYLNPPKNHGDPKAYIDAQITWHAQEIRSSLGRPLRINSSFRSPEYNARIKGATYSRHQYGDAADIDVDEGRSDAEQRAQEIVNAANRVGVDFIEPTEKTVKVVGGKEVPSWVHLDDRGFKF